VSVRDYDLFDLQVMFADEIENLVNVIPGIDDHGFVGSLIANHRAVALQRADAKYFVDHISSYCSEERGRDALATVGGRRRCRSRLRPSFGGWYLRGERIG